MPGDFTRSTQTSRSFFFRKAANRSAFNNLNNKNEQLEGQKATCLHCRRPFPPSDRWAGQGLGKPAHLKSEHTQQAHRDTPLSQVVQSCQSEPLGGTMHRVTPGPPCSSLQC